MNLIEAIGSGRPFRRRGQRRWLARAGEWFNCTDGDQARVYFNHPDLIASDWETKRPADEILNARIELIMRETGIQPKVLDVPPEAYDELSNQFYAQRFFDATYPSLQFRGCRIVKGYVG